MAKTLVQTTGQFVIANTAPPPAKDDGSAVVIRPYRPHVVDLDNPFIKTQLQDKNLELADNGKKLPADLTDAEYGIEWKAKHGVKDVAPEPEKPAEKPDPAPTPVKKTDEKK